MLKNRNSKASQVKNHILDAIEKGEYAVGVRLPGAKKIAAELNISLAVVQSVLDSLVCEGVLFTIPRGGSYVHSDWRSRILQSNISTFTDTRPWFYILGKILSEEIPEMRISKEFRNSIYEIRTTSHVQAHHNEYMNLQELFDECCPDKSDIDLKPFESFYFDQKLVGIPFMHSPRVMFYNPRVLSENNCPEPHPGWTWDDFTSMVMILRNKIEPSRIIHWNSEPHYWMNLVARSGGYLINPKLADPVRIDSPETINGLNKVQELGQLVNRGKGTENYINFWESESIAFHIGGRDRLPMITKVACPIKTAPLPLIRGGVDTTMQITDLMCIRKNCSNPVVAKKIIQIILSQKFQNALADKNYGIPILKSAAKRTLDQNTQEGRLFISEAAKVRRESKLETPELYNIVKQGVEICLHSDADIKPAMHKLADIVRTITAIRNKSWNINIKTKQPEVSYV